jgi:hypothetical protein
METLKEIKGEISKENELLFISLLIGAYTRM